MTKEFNFKLHPDTNVEIDVNSVHNFTAYELQMCFLSLLTYTRVESLISPETKSTIRYHIVHVPDWSTHVILGK